MGGRYLIHSFLLARGEEVIDVLGDHHYKCKKFASLTAGLGGFALGEGSESEMDVVLGGGHLGEALSNHAGVGENDTVHGEAEALDGMLVHFCFNNYYT